MLFAGGCETSPPPARDSGEPIIQPRLELRIPDGEPLRFGQLAAADLIVTNISDRPMLLRSVQLVGQVPRFFQRSIALGGSLLHRKALRHYTYDPEAAGFTPEVFEDDWLLLPGESRTYTENFRVRHPVQLAHLLYRSIPYSQYYTPRMREEGVPEMATLDRDVYFPRPDPHDDRRLQFGLRTRSSLSEYRRSESGTVGRLVVIPDEEAWELLYLEFTFQIPIEDPETPANLIERSGASPGSTVTAWLRRGIWVIDDPVKGETFGWTTEEKRIPLPRSAPEVFDILDELPEDAPLPVDRGGDGREPLLLPPGEIDEFLEGLRKRGEEVHPHYLESPDGRFLYGLKILPAGSLATPESPEPSPSRDSPEPPR